MPAKTCQPSDSTCIFQKNMVSLNKKAKKEGSFKIMLQNTVYRLKKEKKLRIGYFGGSITEGSGASIQEETSWRARTTAFMRVAYPEAEITEIMAAIGGTGTDLGICRIERDLLSKNPDLVFIEFAVNDSGMPFKEQLNFFEACLRRIIENDPTTDVICVFTATKNTEKLICETGDYRSRSTQAFLCHHYGIPTLDIGEHMRTAVHHAGDDWLVYTTDTVHPNDKGYRLYADVVRSTLIKWLAIETPQSLKTKPLPAKISAILPAGKLTELGECENALCGWHFVDKRFKNRFPHYYKADGIGSTIDYEFDGTGFGLFWIMDNNGGMMDISIDGGAPVRISAWDEYCPKFSRSGYTFPFKYLENKHHKVHIEVFEEKAPESLGNDISIFAFLTL